MMTRLGAQVEMLIASLQIKGGAGNSGIVRTIQRKLDPYSCVIRMRLHAYDEFIIILYHQGVCDSWLAK